MYACFASPVVLIHLTPRLWYYLQDVSNFKHRKAHLKLRASDYKLNIEVERYNKLPINERNKSPLNERVCKFCDVDIKDEKTFNFELLNIR